MAYHGYGGRCVGRLLSYLYTYTFHSDHWQFGADTIESGGKVIANYTWKGISDIPEFNFIAGDYSWINEEHNRRWKELSKDLEKYKKKARPHFSFDMFLCYSQNDKTKYTNFRNIEMYMGRPYAEAFKKLYSGNLELISEKDYDLISKELDKEIAKLFD